MLSHNPRPLVFFNDTKLLHVTITLPAIEGGKRVRLLSAKCFAPQSQFFHRIHDSTKNIQKVACRLLSLPGYPNLLECDNYLSRYFQYSTGIPSTMTCPRGYRQTIAECKAWALKPCKGISNNEAHWLKSNRMTRREAWACHAGGLGVFKFLYETFSGKKVRNKSCRRIKNNT